MPGKNYTVRKHDPDRHTSGRVVTIRMTDEMYDRLEVAMHNNKTPRPHDTVGAYIKWLIETQLMRQR